MLDEVLVEKDKLDLANKQFAQLRETLKLTQQTDGTFKIGIALKDKDEAQAARSLIAETLATVGRVRTSLQRSG